MISNIDWRERQSCCGFSGNNFGILCVPYTKLLVIVNENFRVASVLHPYKCLMLENSGNRES